MRDPAAQECSQARYYWESILVSDPLSFKIDGTSTNVAASDAPSSSTLVETVTLVSIVAQFAYLIEKVNAQL